MEICDAPFAPDLPGFRICDESDDAEAEARGLSPYLVTLAVGLAREAREAAALAAAAMGDRWRLPAPPVHVEHRGSEWGDL